jgi:hypothetical protein
MDIFGPSQKQVSIFGPTQTDTNSAVFGPATPEDVIKAQKEVGKQEDQGYCEQFVSQLTDQKQWGPTAADAFTNQVKAGVGVADPSLKDAPVGSKVYFAPDDSNGGNGHVGILVDTKGNFISADYNRVETNNLKTWHQTPIGYVPVH